MKKKIYLVHILDVFYDRRLRSSGIAEICKQRQINQNLVFKLFLKADWLKEERCIFFLSPMPVGVIKVYSSMGLIL
jgi:hypothetical protein